MYKIKSILVYIKKIQTSATLLKISKGIDLMRDNMKSLEMQIYTLLIRKSVVKDNEHIHLTGKRKTN